MLKRSREEVLRILKDGSIKFTSGSGIFTTNPAMVEWADKNLPEMKVLTTKSIQVTKTSGNREPIIAEISVGNYGNAVGLKNPGMDKAYEELRKLKEKGMNNLLNISLAAKNPEDFITLVKKFEDIADIIELNFSCPHAHAGFGSSIGCDVSVAKMYMEAIRKETKKDILIFPKLTPNVDNVGEIAKALIDSGADGIVAINTVGPELYTESHTGKPILYNPGGHKGGKSGEWVRELALKQIAEIRETIGEEIPIIGMGGVTRGADVKAMKDAGADVIGVGSSLARVKMPLRSDYFTALKKDAENSTDEASSFLSNERLAEYKTFKITKVKDHTETLRIIELEGTLDYDASQFVFLWVPDVGEKPFAVACNDPLTFIIRKKPYDPEQKKGLVTHALFELKEGEELSLRGLYGIDAPLTNKSRAIILAGGTGVAIVPGLAKKLKQEGKEVTVYYGIKDKDEVVMESEISKYAKYIPVADEGKVGRVLEVMEEDLKEEMKKENGEENIKEDIKDNINNICFYNMGPDIMMKIAMDLQEKLGAKSDSIFSSLETNTMCGIGMCSECQCGGKLTCQEGTFISKEFLDDKGIDISSL